MTRFNESIDQSLTCAINRFVRDLEAERAANLANECAAREEAERANRAKDQLLAMLSHELRTPLTPSLLLTESLLERTEHSQEVVEVVRRIGL